MIVVLLGAFCCVMTSCNNKDEDLEEGGNPTIYAHKLSAQIIEQQVDSTQVDSAFSKTSLSMADVNGQTVWSTNDSISVFTSVNSEYVQTPYLLYAGSGTVKGGFSGNGPASGPYYAVYPYNKAHSMTNNASGDPELTVTIPQIQYYAENSFGQAANTMVAYTADANATELNFKNLCGILEIQISGAAGSADKVFSLTVESNQILSGTGTVTMNYGANVPSLTMASSGSKMIILDCGEEGITLQNTPISFFVVVPANTHDFKVEINNAGNGILRKTASSIAIHRSMIRRMISFTYDVSIHYFGEANSQIIGTNASLNFDITPYEIEMSNGGFDNANETFTDAYAYPESPTVMTDPAYVPNYAAVLWQTTSGLVTIGNITTTGGNSRQLTISTTNGVPGNALVGVFHVDDINDPTVDLNSDHLLWSFHIWVTDYNPNTQNDTITLRPLIHEGDNNDLDKIDIKTSGAFVFMDRNLGAYHNDPAQQANANSIGLFGLYYQWGRKDPFVGAIENDTYLSGNQNDIRFGETNFDNVIAPLTNNHSAFLWDRVQNVHGTMKYASLHPTHLIMPNSNTDDWLTGSLQNDYLWGTYNESNEPNISLGYKTVNDPCPKGWRVPSQGAFTRFFGRSGDPQTIINGDYNALTGNGLYKYIPNESTQRVTSSLIAPFPANLSAKSNGLKFYITNDYTRATTNRRTTFIPFSGYISGNHSDGGDLRGTVTQTMINNSTAVIPRSYLWTSSAYQKNSRYGSGLQIDYYYYYRVKSFGNIMRATACPVRCVKETPILLTAAQYNLQQEMYFEANGSLSGYVPE